MPLGTKKELLDVLSNVKAKVMDKLGKKDFPMPQFILVGKQSVGKSRLIEAMAGEQFNFISGTLGSRRPTVLEFRNVSALTESKWFIRCLETGAWSEHPIQQVMKIIGDAHECLGTSVTKEAVYVRIESPSCVDMQIVDLPGFRDFASSEDAKILQKNIYDLVTEFMRDPKNVMLCVEQAGDAANMSTLAKCKEVDANMDRTILIRNKLDKYYNDLTPDNVQQWIAGHGDLNPKILESSFSLTLPWWPDETAIPMPFHLLTDKKNEEDVSTLSAKGLSGKELKRIGFKNFVEFMDKKVENMFSAAIDPVLASLKVLKDGTISRQTELTTEFTNTDPSKVLNTTRDCGKTFANALDDIMRGTMDENDENMDMETELRNFHEHHQQAGSDHFMMLPSDDFSGLDDYLQYLRSCPFMPTFDEKLSGGAQFRRLLMEVEVFLRFSEVAADTKKKDVIQARGVSMTSLTWRDVVVKLLSAEAHVPLKERVQYVGERVTHYFESQKAVVLHFMVSCKGSTGRFHSADLGPHGVMISSNPMMKHLIYECYDKVARRQLGNFMDLFQNMLTSTFANPWTFLKGGKPADDDSDDKPVQGDPDLRIPEEIQHRSGIEAILNKDLQNIPTESTQIDKAVDLVQKLVLKIYSLIRSQVCDQVELFSESFFKTPMLRQLGMDMSKIELTDDDKIKYKERREKNVQEKSGCEEALKEVSECIEQLENFKFMCQADQMTK